jgi:hypothetical protein
LHAINISNIPDSLHVKSGGSRLIHLTRFNLLLNNIGYENANSWSMGQRGKWIEMQICFSSKDMSPKEPRILS